MPAQEPGPGLVRADAWRQLRAADKRPAAYAPVSTAIARARTQTIGDARQGWSPRSQMMADAGQADIERPETLPGAASAGTAQPRRLDKAAAQDEEQQESRSRQAQTWRRPQWPAARAAPAGEPLPTGRRLPARRRTFRPIPTMTRTANAPGQNVRRCEGGEPDGRGNADRQFGLSASFALAAVIGNRPPPASRGRNLADAPP